MDLFRRKVSTRCNECNLECYTTDKLERHKDIAHQDHDTSRASRRMLKKGKQFG